MRILVIGVLTSPENTTCEVLGEHGFEATRCNLLHQGFDCLKEQTPDAVLFEVSEPDCDIALFRSVQSLYSDLPIVVLSVQEEPEIALEFIRAGAQDYLIQGLASDASLSRCLHYAIERNHLALAQQHSQSKMRRVLEHAYDAFITTDADLQITEWNAAAERTFGWKKADILGQSLATIIPHHLQRQFIHNIQAYFEKEKSSFLRPSREILAARRSGQTFPSEFGIFKIDKDEQCVFCAFVRDVTRFKKTNEELEHMVHERTERLMRSNEELYQFAKIASHDLQEPLRAVQGFANLLADAAKGKLDSECIEFIDFILNGVTRMKELIQSILIHSRMNCDPGIEECTDCNTVVDQVLLDLAALIDETHANFDVTALPEVSVEYSQMVQLFQNLIGNSIKYRGSDVPSISIGAKRSMQQWLFSVCDNGIGIEPQYADQIFDMFSRLHAKGQYPGTGIGLAICKKIVTSHGGTIWVESSLGKGSIFMFTLPAVKEKRTNTMQSTIEILLAEDTPSDVRLAQEALKRSALDYKLSVVTDGVEAMDYLNRAKETEPRKLPDVILLDLNMPRRNGHSVLEAIKKDPVLRPIPVVLLTVSEREEDVMEALNSKMNYYLSKPIAAEKLSHLLKSIHQLHNENDGDSEQTDEETHIRLVLAGNPHTAMIALSKLADDPHERVRARVAENPALTEELQLKLSDDSQADVRIRLCENKNILMQILEKLATDENADVRFAASSSASTTKTLLETLSHDENVFVCANAKKMLAEMQIV